MKYEYFVTFVSADGRLGSTAVTVSQPITGPEVLSKITDGLSEQVGENVVITYWRRWEEPE